MSEKKVGLGKKIMFGLVLLVGLGVFSLGYYSWPRTDSVMVVNTEVKRITPFMGATNETVDQQRVRTTSAESGEAMVFRNEDAILFPPYMKWDSEDLQTMLDAAAKQQGESAIMCFKHYGFRIHWPITAFPNVTSAEPGYCSGDKPEVAATNEVPGEKK